MRSLIRFFIDRHLLVNMIVVATLGVGFFIVSKTQRESFPATSLNLVQITTVFPGASAGDIETKVTIPIERALRGVDGIEVTSSISSENVSAVVVELFDHFGDDEADEAVADIQAALDGIQGFPPDLENPPFVVLLDPARIPALEVFLGGPRDDVIAAANALDDILSRVDGVSEVIPLGFGDPEVHVLVQPQKARAVNVTLDEVMHAIRQKNRSETGGKLEAGVGQRQVVLAGTYDDPTEVKDTVLRFDPMGGLLRVSDVARVARTTEDKGMRVHGNGEPGVSLVVRKRASADIIRVVDALRARLQTYTPPDGVTVRVFNDSSELARDRLEIVSTNGFGGIALVILVLVVFLTRRIAFWVAFGIPFAMFGVLAILPLFHITVNMVSMAAFVLVIGLIVDDAIVVAERIAFYRERGLSPRDAGVEGTREMSVPVIASSLTTIMAFSPMFALGGVSGRFSWAIPTVVILALSVSLFECFFLLPAHVSGDHQHKKHAGGSSDEKAEWMVRLEAAYQRFLKALLPFRIPFVIGFALLFVGSGVLARSCMALTLFPQDDAKGLYVKVEMPLGTPLEKTEAAIGYLEQQIPTLLGEDFDGMTARIGHKVPQIAKSRGDAENEALLTVYLVDDRHLPALTWVDRLKRDLKPPSGATLLFEHIPIGPPVGRPVTVHISSPDDGLRREGVRHVVSTLSTLEGVGDIETDENEGLRQIDLRPDFQRLAQRGVDVETVTRAVKAAFFGLPVTETRKSDETTTIRVRFDTPARRDLADLLDMQVRARDGMPVPLRDLLDPEERPSVARIHHRDGVRATTVTASVDVSKGQTASGVARVLRGSVLPKYESMPGIRISLGGEAKATEKTLGEMPQVGLLALIGMLMVVTLLFGSVLQAIFIVIAVPLGYVGVIWTFFAHQMPLSFFAILGAVGLSGVVVNDSIVMVSTLSPRIGEGLDGIVEAAADRLRPVLLTTLTTVVGVMPTAYGLGGRDALLSPMSLALGWGLVFATVITLLLVPALFMVRLDVEGWLSSRLGRDAARAPETAPAPSAAPANVDKVQPRDAAE